MNIITREFQTLFDIALQECGNVEFAYTIAWLNNISISDMIPAGTEIVIPDIDIRHSSDLEFYQTNNNRPATGTNLLFINKIVISINSIPFQLIANILSVQHYLITI